MFRFTLTMVGLLAIAGCSAVPDQPPEIQVERKVTRHMVEASDRPGVIAEPEARALRDFIETAAGGRPEDLHLILRANGPDRLVPAVSHIAVAAGVQPSKIEFDHLSADAGAGSDRVEVVAETAIASVPDCPRLSHLTISDWRNQDSSNYGCALQTDLAAMASDKRDLAQGEDGGLTSGELTSAAIDRLREGKVKEINATGTRGQ